MRKAVVIGGSPRAVPNSSVLKKIRAERTACRVDEGGGQCGSVSESLSATYGWREEYGQLLTLGGYWVTDHAWNWLPDGSILDATVDQFEGDDMPGDILIAAPGSRLYRRYIVFGKETEEQWQWMRQACAQRMVENMAECKKL